MSDDAPPKPHTFTLGQAAKEAGLSKPSISAAIKEGRLTANKNPDGSYSIQAAELFRVYPPSSKPNGAIGSKIDDGQTGKDYRLVEREIEVLRERLANQSEERDRERRQLTDEIDDLRRRLDRAEEDRRKMTAVLTDQSAKPPTPAPAQLSASPPRSLWARLTGKG